MSFIAKSTSSAIQFSNDLQNSSMASFSPIDLSPYRIINPMITSHRPPQQISISNHDSTTSYTLSNSCTNLNIDASSLLLNMSSSILGDYNNFSITLPENIEENQIQEAGNLVKELPNVNVDHMQEQWGNVRSVIGFPVNADIDAWNKSKLLWDSSPCPSEMSTSYSTN